MSLTQKHYYRRNMHITSIIPSYLNTWPNLTDLRTHASTIKTRQHLEIYVGTSKSFRTFLSVVYR